MNISAQRSFLALSICLLFSAAPRAAAQGTTGIPIPNGMWTMVMTKGIPEESNGWEQLVYASATQQSIMLSQYHQFWSEPNESLVGYNFDTNSWDVVDMGGLFHTENMPEGGESQGYFEYNPNNNTLVYYCCTTGSNQAENVFHTWWYDVAGQTGIDKHTSPKPPYSALQPGGAFDVAHDTYVFEGGDSYVGTWTYNPNTNAWQRMNPGGTPPDPSLILAGMAYSTAAQKVYLFGGLGSSGYSSGLYAYDVPTNTWTLITPANGVSPPGRNQHGFAYDSTNNVFLMYGGHNSSGVLGDTWIFDPAANLWTQLSPSQSPPIAASPVWGRLAYDSDHNAFVLAQQASGGYFGGSWVPYSIQTWLFRYQGGGPNAGTLSPSAQPTAGSINRNIASWAKDPSLVSSGNSLYVAWSETSSPFDTSSAAWPHIYVSEYAAGNWLPIGQGSAAISAAGDEAHAPAITLVGGTPWVSWYQANNTNQPSEVFAGNWNGSTWQSTGAGFVGSNPAYQGRSQLTSIGGVPYLALLETDKSFFPQEAFAYVKSWNGTSWTLLGGGLNRNTGSGTTADSISITTDGSYPYVAWTEYLKTYGGSNGEDTDTIPQVYVSKWNGSQWVALGGSLNVNASNWASDASIAYFGGQPYVAWTERTESGNSQLYVKTWNGTSWVLTGSGALNQNSATGWAFHPSLVADAGTNSLHVGWVEQSNLGQKAQVYVSQYAGGSWNTLGSSLNVDTVHGSAQRVSIGVYNGEPIAAWGEVNSGSLRQIYVKQWSGSAWAELPGTGGGSDTTAPTTPTNLSATGVSANQINLSWSPSTDLVGVTGYYVYRNGSQVANVTQLANSTNFIYQDTGLNAGTSYSYRVAAYDAAGNVSSQSSAANGKTLGSNSPPPSVSITAPANGATVSGSVTVSANATSSIGMQGVQFQVDGANIGSQVTGAGPTYSVSWNSTNVSNGSHTLTAIATDTSGNIASASISVTVGNAVVLAIAGVSSSAISSSGATVTWSTNEPATSQVAYGLTNTYGSTTPLNSTLMSSHSVTLSGLAASTTYHYQALSQDSQANQAASGDYTFTTAAAGTQTLLQIQGNASEVSGVTNGSTVTPGTAPTGFTGTVVVNGTGSLNFAPAQTGNGVYFLNCCSNTNNAYYQFTGSAIGNIFNTSQGQISFYLDSRYSFAQRESSGASPRYTFDVRDGNGNHLFYFLTQVSSGYLEFTYATGGAAQFYYVPQGKENTLFGSGVILQVTLTWNGSITSLYLNNTLVKSSSYTPTKASWTAASNFDLGAYQYSNVGGYNVSDDIINEFTVSSAGSGNNPPPSVSITAPANGTTVNGAVTVSANATSSVGMQGVQFQVDGVNIGSQVTGSGPTYSVSWNSTSVSNGSHTLTAVATDTSGNTATSNISVTVNNTTGPVISGVSASSITSSGATINWTTNEPATSQVAYGLTNTYGSTTPLNSTLVSSHSVTLSGLAAATPYHYQVLSQDSQGNQAASGDFTFTTSASGTQTFLQIQGNASEVSGVTNGSTVTPGTAPSGFTGTVVVHGTGSVNFAPAQTGNGVYFLNCCSSTNNAYYQFTGSTIGNIFNTSQGQISFYLESRYSFAQRESSAASPRYVFDVRDGNGNHLFYFLTQVTSSRLQFTYATGGAAQFYYVPAGTENTLFGSGVILQVTLTWNGSVMGLYLNNTLVKSSSYTPTTPNWTAGSNFELGAYQYLNTGGYNVSDDIINEFTVTGPGQ